MKSVIVITLLCVCAISAVSVSEPEYEIPFVQKSNSPLDISFNHRLDMMNKPSSVKAAYREAGNKKDSLRSELARSFSLRALNDWLNHLGSQDLNMMLKHDFIDDVSNLNGFARVLQAHVTEKANAVMDKLALMDLKLKEKTLVEHEIQEIKHHPGNISSNLGDNLAWKERLEDIVNNSASIHSEFDVALNGICTVIHRIGAFVNSMNKSSTTSKKAHKSQPVRNNQILVENNNTPETHVEIRVLHKKHIRFNRPVQFQPILYSAHLTSVKNYPHSNNQNEKIKFNKNSSKAIEKNSHKVHKNKELPKYE